MNAIATIPPASGLVLTLTRVIDATPARARHWTAENRARHEQMGFHQGWGESVDRLVRLVTAA